MTKHAYQRPLILLVEDHLPLMRNLTFLLEVAGYEVVSARDGRMAVDVLRSQLPDLILSDIDMPGMDGYDLLCHVRSARALRHIPFIFTSDRYHLHDLMYALDLGADDYVPKPYDIADILDAIDRTLIGMPKTRIPYSA